jgi:nucleoside-diphosphate-sugar epimerase
MVEAFIQAAGAELTPNGARVFNIAGPEPLTVREMVRMVSDAMGVRAPRVSIPPAAGWMAGATSELAYRALRREPPFSRRSLAFFVNDNAYSTGAAQRDLGFRPRIDFEEGIRRVVSTTGVE